MKTIFDQLEKLNLGGNHWENLNTENKTPKEFLSWVTKHTNQLKKALKEVGFTEFNKVSKGYFYYSMFVYSEATGWVYLSISDVRAPSITQILIRTAANTKDYGGGSNNYIGLSDSDRFERDLRSFVSKSNLYK